jgi:hypothetical protein
MDSETLDKFSSAQGKKDINVVIECYSDKTIGVQQLADQVAHSLKGTVIDGIELVNIDKDYGFNSPNENKMHLITLTAHYTRE